MGVVAPGEKKKYTVGS